MRLLATTCLMLCTLPLAVTAHADPERAAELVAEGEEFGRAGDFEEALERFRAAELASPDPLHDCLIALTHLRLEQWTQAAYFAERCRERSGGQAPVPWYDDALAQIDEALARGGYAPVTLTSQPPGAEVSTPSSVGLGTVVTPTTLWLAPGTHRFVAAAEGHHPTPSLVRIDSPQPRVEVFELTPIPPAPAPTPEPEVLVEPVPAERRGTPAWPKWTAGAGGAALIAGGVFHTTAYLARRRAIDPQHDYDTEVQALKRDRLIAAGLYGVSAVALSAAMVGWSRGGSREPEMRLGVSLHPNEALVRFTKRY
jgi:hypothetical protein